MPSEGTDPGLCRRRRVLYRKTGLQPSDPNTVSSFLTSTHGIKKYLLHSLIRYLEGGRNNICDTFGRNKAANMRGLATG